MNNGQCYTIRHLTDDSYAVVIDDKCYQLIDDGHGAVRYKRLTDVHNDHFFSEVPRGRADDEVERCIKLYNAKQSRIDKRLLDRFFTMDIDYGQIFDPEIERDPEIRKRLDAGRQIRLLRVDPWEALVTFICSQNNNIARTKKMALTLCNNFGKYVCSAEGEVFFSFPKASVLASLDKSDLDRLGFGYRSSFIIDTAKRLESEGGDTVLKDLAKSDDYKGSFEYLCGYPGVGPKVADCVLLFGLTQLSSIPIDRHMLRFATQIYGQKFASYSKARRFYLELFGDCKPGLVQNVVFTYQLRRFSQQL